MTNDYSLTDPESKLNTLQFLRTFRAAYDDNGYLNWEDSYYKAAEKNQDGVTFALMAIDPAMGGAAEFRGMVATGEEIKGATGVVKSVGLLTGAVKEIDATEMLVVNEWLAQGRTVEKIARSSEQGVKMYDFVVDGVKIEVKSPGGTNTGTAAKRIMEGFGQGAETVVIDGRQAGYSVEQATEAISRAAGKFADKILPGKVEVWTTDGIVTYP